MSSRTGRADPSSLHNWKVLDELDLPKSIGPRPGTSKPPIIQELARSRACRNPNIFLKLLNRLLALICRIYTLYEYITLSATFWSFAALASAALRSAAAACCSKASHLMLRLVS